MIKRINKFRLSAVLLAAILLPVLVFAGLEWDPNLRPVKLVSRSQSEVILDQVRWGSNFDGKDFSTVYKQARIRFGEVDKVYFCVEDFPPRFVAAHISLAFTFKSKQGVVTSDGTQHDPGLVISATNRLRKGEKPSSITKAFFPGRAKDPWPLVFEVGTLTDRVQNSLTICRQTIKMYQLNLSPAQAEMVLRAGIDLSLVDRSKDFYHVLQNNCVVMAFNILKQGLGEKAFPDYWSVRNRIVSHNCSLPKLSAGYLSKRGLSSGKRITLAEGSRFVTIPTAMGQYRIDLTTLPGYGRVKASLVPFVIELENYYELSDASAGLQHLADLIGPTNSDFFKILKTRSMVDDDVCDAIESLVRMVQMNPLETLPYYVSGLQKNRLTRDPRYAQLNRALARLVRFQLTHAGENGNREYYQALKAFDTFAQ